MKRSLLILLSVACVSLGASDALAAKRGTKKKPSPARRTAPRTEPSMGYAPASPPVQSYSVPPTEAPQTYAVAAPASEPETSEGRRSALGLHVNFPTPIYNGGQTFYQGFAVGADYWTPFSHDGFFGHLDLTYQQFSIKNLADVALRQAEVLAGVEFLSFTKSFFARPFIAFDGGGAYNWLTFKNYDSTQNASLAFVARFRPGLNIPFSQSFSLSLSAPFTAYFSKGTLFTLGGHFNVRIAL